MKNLLYLLIVINFLAACASSKNNRVEVGELLEQLSSKSELLKGIKQKHLDNNEEALNHFKKHPFIIQKMMRLIMN